MGSDIGVKRSLTSPRSIQVWVQSHLASILSFCLGMVVSYLLFAFPNNLSKSQSLRSTDCAVFMSKYRGHEYRSSSTIGTPKCLVESKFLKVQQHTLTLPGTSTVIDDWLFIDYHDRINVLVEAPKQDSWEEPHFYVFEQTKYALEDRMSLAVVGGIVEPTETPEDAAKREVSEETHVVCQRFVFLGRYRTDVNRGSGWTSIYVARECKPGTLEQSLNEADEVGVPDTERQDLQTISLTDMATAVMKGRFLEIQWTATVALAVLHELRH